MLEENVKPLITCNLINTDFCRGNFYDKIKSSKDLFKKALSAEKYDWANVFWTLFCYLVKCIILAFVGVLTIGIENSYILRVTYEPHLSDEARCSETPRFSITKIWYA